MKAVVLLSGGLDSTLCATMAEREFHEGALALTILYGQKHEREVGAAERVAAHLHMPHETVQLEACLFAGGGSALIDPGEEVPSIGYDEIAGVSPLYVPFRNGIFLSMATAFALKHDASYVYFGAHAEDAQRWAYPDCTPEFIGAMANAIYVGTYHKVRLLTPLQWMDKKEIVHAGQLIGSPVHLTWSCYRGGEVACGACPTCRSRLAAFQANGMEDPIAYEVLP
ncbi:MAG: 7-cyano-7-deazaguanine synthase QueC [Thermoleophilia bacterium]